MEIIVEKKYCTGCGACVAVCSKSAISTYYDSEGFEYPIIDKDKCINCGLCQKICPPLNFINNLDDRKRNSNIQRGFAARNKNFNERYISSSGGIFPLLAREVFKDNGVVVGVGYDNDFNAIYKIIESEKDLPLIQGSKYLQCKISPTVFKSIKEILITGRLVLFSGLACQCEGLKGFLRKDFDNLICIDLICMGVPSPIIWQYYLQTYFAGEHVKKVNFKDKTVGWNSFNLAIETDKQSFCQHGADNPYFKSMFKTYNMRPSCFNCKFKLRERISDITLADCWGVSDIEPLIDDNKGLSAVLIHSSRGEFIWECIKPKVDYVERPFEVFVKGNPNLVQVRTMDERYRKRFYSFIENKEYNNAFEFASSNDITYKSIIRRIISKIIEGVK